MTITALPTPPSRDDPANFATRADAFLGALPDFATEANALAAAVNADETAAAASASAAASSASAASSSASNAASSASAAASSASNASTSETNASNSATAAATSASNANSSASNAASSASTASTQASNAANSATAAAGSASTASTQATNAANSASSASAQATNAANSASAASTSASNASTSATNAANSASAASGSATSAANSATAAAASYDSFDDRYLGAKSSDPSVDNDGNALITGALYFNTTANEMRVYSGSAWLASYLPAGTYLALTGGTMTGNITFAAGQSFDASKITGPVAIANGGTGASTAAGARTNLLPSYASNATKVLKVNAGATDVEWATDSGSVTSITAGTGLSGGTITSTGTIALATAYGDTSNPYAAKTANYVLAAPNGSSGAPTFRALVAADIPTLNQNTTGNAATATALQTARTINGVSFDGTANITIADSTKLPLTGGTMTGAIGFAAGQTWPTFNQNTTGTASNVTGTVAIANGGTGATTQSGARTNLGLAIGTDVQAQLVSGTNIKTVNSSSLLGSGDLSVGTVTSVGATAGTGINVSGSPITSSGSLTITNTGVTSLTAGSGISVSASTGDVTITNTASGGLTEITSAFASSSTSYSVSLDFNTYKYYTLICTAANSGTAVDLGSIKFNNDTGARYSSWINGGNNFTNINSISGASNSAGGTFTIDIYTRSASALGGALVSGFIGAAQYTASFSGGYTPVSTASITSIQFNATGYWVLYGVK